MKAWKYTYVCILSYFGLNLISDDISINFRQHLNGNTKVIAHVFRLVARYKCLFNHRNSYVSRFFIIAIETNP